MIPVHRWTSDDTCWAWLRKPALRPTAHRLITAHRRLITAVLSLITAAMRLVTAPLSLITAPPSFITAVLSFITSAVSRRSPDLYPGSASSSLSHQGPTSIVLNTLRGIPETARWLVDI